MGTGNEHGAQRLNEGRGCAYALPMDTHTALELQSLRAELRRTRRALLLLFLGLVGVALSAQASGGPKELRADRLVIGTPENGIVLEFTRASGPTLRLTEGRALVHLQAHSDAAVMQLVAHDVDGTRRSVEAGVSGPEATGVSVKDQDLSVKNGAEHESRMGLGGVVVTTRPAQGKVQVLAKMP